MAFSPRPFGKVPELRVRNWAAFSVADLSLKQSEVVLPHLDDVTELKDVRPHVVGVEQGHEKHQLKS